MPTNLERPDEHVAGAANELFCWMPGNMSRECGPDCVAYDPRCINDAKYSSCMVLNSIRSVSGLVAKMVDLKAAMRGPQVVVPSVNGGR